jgi:NAD(P)-dependent dehydrogenase (short-subunit alcohol dehydrogenase family)
MIFVTGGAGFIGANFVLDWLAQGAEPVLNLDKLTYAGNRENLAALEGDARHVFVHGDIGDSALVSHLLARSLISPPSRMSIDPFTAPATLFRPMWWAPFACSRRCARTPSR